MYKTITVSKEAYDKLSALKRSDESFSEVIVELAEKSSLERFFGSISKEEAKELRQSSKAGRFSVSKYFRGK